MATSAFATPTLRVACGRSRGTPPLFTLVGSYHRVTKSKRHGPARPGLRQPHRPGPGLERHRRHGPLYNTNFIFLFSLGTKCDIGGKVSRYYIEHYAFYAFQAPAGFEQQPGCLGAESDKGPHINFLPARPHPKPLPVEPTSGHRCQACGPQIVIIRDRDHQGSSAYLIFLMTRHRTKPRTLEIPVPMDAREQSSRELFAGVGGRLFSKRLPPPRPPRGCKHSKTLQRAQGAREGPQRG